MDKLSEKLVSTLKSNTYDSVYFNTLAKLPIIITKEGTYVKNGSDDITKETRLINVKKFHYDDTWYGYKESVDHPEETFGILKVFNLPFKSLEKLNNKKSFICRMDQLIFTDIIHPFMLFINGKFVNWNIIDVVFDCDESYLLIHGTDFSYNKLKYASDMYMVILPFGTEFIGRESYNMWKHNYDMLRQYIQDSLYINENNKIVISVPTMSSIYKHRGMVYNVGAWMYSQIRMEQYGLLSSEQIKELRNIKIIRNNYDKSGNIINSYNARFNALDRDSYDPKLLNNIISAKRADSLINEFTLFRFDGTGNLDYTNKDDGTYSYIISSDQSMRSYKHLDLNKDSIIDHSKIDEILFRESFLVFRDGLIYPEGILTEYQNNVFAINEDTDAKYDVLSFNPMKIENIITHSDNFDKTTFSNIVKEFAESADKNSDIEKLIKDATDPLNYNFNNKDLYEANVTNGLSAIIQYNPLLLKDLIETNIKSVTYTGAELNARLNTPFANEHRRGLKIPRCKYSDHETYVIIFVNGELISNYSEMYAASNYFFLPINNDFSDGDIIEYLYFTDCDNNEIHFNITDNMLLKLKDSDEIEFVESELFKEYINFKDIKIFADYPEEILVYKDLIDKNNNIAFNISYRNTNGNLLLFKNVVNNKHNNLTAVSSRKFIYERLYVNEKSYRLKLSERFRYCDNQKQYILFINGRRMDDDTFLITIPKYSRPFWASFLYTSKFVNPGDRVELFYVPEELCNINTVDEAPATFDNSGYIETDKTKLDVPYCSNSYLYFINGKKIPSSDIVSIDTHTIRIKSNTGTVKNLRINKAYRNINEELALYMSAGISNYDNLIDYIINTFGCDYLDRLFNISIKMIENDTEKEIDITQTNVNRLAIINEIVRDFWVSSGYNYNELPFIYDYELDEFITKDKDGNYMLPALDATKAINIKKNDIHLIDFYSKYKDINYIFEIGDDRTLGGGIEFEWKFNDPIEGTIPNILQYVNNELITPGYDSIEKTYSYFYNHSIDKNTDIDFKFVIDDYTINNNIAIRFHNGIFYGTVDEDILEHYVSKELLNFKNTFIVVPKNKIIPSSGEQELENESISIIKKDNEIISNISIANGITSDEKLVSPEYIAYPIKDDGSIDFNNVIDGVLLLKDESPYNDKIGFIDKNGNIIEDAIINNTISEDVLPTILNNLISSTPIIGYNGTKVYQDNASLNIDTYKIGNNNYFIYACPKRLAYDENGRCNIKFCMPDINDEDLIAYGKDDLTIPVYTDGSFDYQNNLIKLNECKMVYMGEFEYTNGSGYTETYVMWKSNGFFTRKYENYEFNISIKSVEDFMEIEPKQEESSTVSSFRAINTASPLGSKTNDEIILIDTLIL
jgi:hypothetical protein